MSGLNPTHIDCARTQTKCSQLCDTSVPAFVLEDWVWVVNCENPSNSEGNSNPSNSEKNLNLQAVLAFVLEDSFWVVNCENPSNSE